MSLPHGSQNVARILPRLAYEWFLVTRAFGTSGPYRDEEGVRRDARQWSRYLIYRRWVIRGPYRLAEAKGDWSDIDESSPAHPTLETS